MAILTHSRTTDFLLLSAIRENKVHPLGGLAATHTLAKALVIICLLGIGICGFGVQPSCGQQSIASAKSEYSYRKAWFDSLNIYARRVRESCDLCNDHPDILRFNRHLKINLKAQYCSSAGIYSAFLAGMKFDKVSAMAYSWRQQDKLVFYPAMLKGNSRRKPDIRLMDAVIMTFSHVEYASLEPNRVITYDDDGIYTIGCNTKGGKNRVQGCYNLIKRPWKLVYAVYNHVTPWYTKNVLTLK